MKKGSSLLKTGCGEDIAAEEKRENPKRRPIWAVHKMEEMDESSEDETYVVSEETRDD